jgi:hypothetical protein
MGTICRTTKLKEHEAHGKISEVPAEEIDPGPSVYRTPHHPPSFFTNNEHCQHATTVTHIDPNIYTTTTLHAQTNVQSPKRVQNHHYIEQNERTNQTNDQRPTANI